MQKVLPVYFIMLLIFVTSARFFPPPQIQSSFSLVTTNPTNMIDVLKLNQVDYQYISRGEYNTVFLANNQGKKQVYYNDRPLKSLALSPSETQVAFLYPPASQSLDELALVLLEGKNGTTRQIYHTKFASWDVTSDLHWLGENYLFFLRHCGTSCQGITLLDVGTGETRNATLSYSSFTDQPAFTHFKDWLGQEYRMDGFLREVTSQTINSDPHLVFVLEDVAGKYLGSKSIPFISLVPQQKFN